MKAIKFPVRTLFLCALVAAATSPSAARSDAGFSSCPSFEAVDGDLFCSLNVLNGLFDSPDLLLWNPSDSEVHVERVDGDNVLVLPASGSSVTQYIRVPSGVEWHLDNVLRILTEVHAKARDESGGTVLVSVIQRRGMETLTLSVNENFVPFVWTGLHYSDSAVKRPPAEVLELRIERIDRNPTPLYVDHVAVTLMRRGS
jgi:hypothetical protein